MKCCGAPLASGPYGETRCGDPGGINTRGLPYQCCSCMDAGRFREMDCKPEEVPTVLAKEAAERDAGLRRPFGCGYVLGSSSVCGRGDTLCGTCTNDRENARRAAEAHAAQLATLREHRRVFIEYARHRIDDEDWRGVSDAAHDLRELDVEIRMLEDRR